MNICDDPLLTGRVVLVGEVEGSHGFMWMFCS